MGEMMVFAVRQLCSDIDIKLAEALAIQFGIDITKQTGLWKSEVDSDSSSIISTMKNGNISLSKIGLVVEHIINLSNDFLSHSFHLIRRSDNGAAHMMARLYPFEVDHKI